MEEFGASSHINGMEDVWPDLNPVEMVDHFAKYEHYDNPPSELGSLERQLGWPGKLSLSELEEFFDAPPGLQLPPQQQQPPPVHYAVTVHPPAPVMMQHPSVERENHHAAGGDEVRVTLLHRTRNSQGCEWQVVAPKEEIRVTRNRGKLFKVLVESSAPFTRNDVHLFLADSHHHPHGTADSPPTTSPSAHPSSSPTYDPTSHSSSSTCSPSTSPPGSSPLHVSAHDLVVQSIEEVQASAATAPDGRSATTYSVELKVKLCIIAKGIQIAARINPSQPHQLRPSVGRSVEFMTHNNGKQKLRTEAKKQKQKDKAGGKKKGKRASESPAAGATAAAKGGLKGEPDMSPDRNGAGARGSNDFTGESQSSDSDDDDHHPPRVPLVAPSFYSMGEQQPHYSAQQPTPQQQQPQMPVVQQPQHQQQQQQQHPLTHHVAPATVSPPVVAQPGGYASGTPTPARRSPFGGPDATQTHTVNGNNPGPSLMMVDPNTGLPYPSSTSAYQQQQPQQAHMEMMPLAGGQATAGGLTMDDASAFAPTTTSVASMGYGASGVMGNAEDLSDYARGEPMLLSSRKRKLGSGGGHGGPPRRGAPASGSPQYPDHLSIRGGLHVEGIVRAQGFMQYSDLRLKTNVEDIVDAVSLISKLQGKRYRWKAQEEVERLTGKSTPIALQNNGGLKVIGLIAQQVQQVLPEVVREDEDGFLSVDYVEIIPVLIEAFNQHLESYHREQRELKDEFESWRRLLGDDDNLPGSQTKTKPGGATKSKPTGKAAASAAKPVLFKEPIGKRSGAVVKTSMDPSSARPLTALSQSEVDIEAAQHVSDEEADSLDRSSSAATTDGELDDDTDVDDRRLSMVDAQRDVDVDQDDNEEEDERPAREEESLLAVDLDRLVANKRHLAALATQMNKLIPDRQYIDLLRYVRDQKKKDTSRNKRLLILFVVACLVLFAVNVAVSIGVPFGVTYLVENHL